MGGTFDKVRKNLNLKLDHKITYAEGRVEKVKGLIEDNEWIYDLLSREDVRSRQVKSKKDPLAENDKLEGILDNIADYILFPQFDNEESEREFDKLREYEKELSEQNKKVNVIVKNEDNDGDLADVEVKVNLIKDKLEDYKKDYLTDSATKKNKAREKLEGLIDKIEETHGIIVNGEGKPKRYKRSKKRNMSPNYWEEMGYSKSDGLFRQEIINTYEDSIEILKHQIGLNIEDMDKRNEYANSLINYFNENKLVLNHGNGVRVLDGAERYHKLRRMYGELVSDYELTKDMLVGEFTFKSFTPTSTVYNFNEDTWYYSEDGGIVEVSSNTLNFSNPDTYKGLIQTYGDLWDKYESNFVDDMWYILRLFEKIVIRTNFSCEEWFVLRRLLKGEERNYIIDEYLNKFNKTLSDKVLSTWASKTLPNKMARTYIESVDDWLYAYKIKGKFKKCSSCSEIKLISNDRYFRKRPDGADGFRNECRQCEVSAKNGKK